MASPQRAHAVLTRTPLRRPDLDRFFWLRARQALPSGTPMSSWVTVCVNRLTNRRRGSGCTVRSRRVGDAAEGHRCAGIPSTDEPDVVRFADNNGIVVEVRVAQ